MNIKIDRLLLEAQEKEKAFDWLEVATLYDKVANIYLKDNLIENAGDYYKRKGYAYVKGSHNADTSEDFKNINMLAIEEYKKASDLYQQTENLPEKLECEANIILLNGMLSKPKEEGRSYFKKSVELFELASKMYEEKNQQESKVKTLIKALESLFLLLICCKEQYEIRKYALKGVKLGQKIWKITKDMKRYDLLAESFTYFGNFSFFYSLVIPFKNDEKFIRIVEDLLKIGDISLELIQENEDTIVKAKVNSFAGGTYAAYAVQYVDDAFKQKEYGDKGISLMEIAVDNILKTKNKRDTIIILFYLYHMTFSLRRFDYIEKRIWKDLKIFLEIRKIYKDSLLESYFLGSIFPTLYYGNLAHRSFIKPQQQKTFAKLAIRYSKESLESFSYLPMLMWSYQMLVWSYSKLAYLTDQKEKQNEYLRNMMNSAKKAKNIGKSYEGGFSVAAGYSSMFKAYKTKADLSLNISEKIEMLKKAIDTHKNYLGYAVESPTGIIAAQIRLGFLYKDLGILTREKEVFEKAKNAYLLAKKESKKRNYSYYTASTYEYLAHIEDRLGNYDGSASFFKKAKLLYTQLFNLLEYEPLKIQVEEKINYTMAWALIEKAKSFHKNKEHLQAKECYLKASEVQKNMVEFSFESDYYKSWALLEEAEHFSKHGSPPEIINRYGTTQEAFEHTITILDEFLKTSTKREVNEKIDKLKIVARLRINYCSAKINLEEGKILGKQGDHLTAAEYFGKAASQFRKVCNQYKIEKERRDLKAIYFLCRAWEHMEFAEHYLEPERYQEAANLFLKASQIFEDNKMKLLSSGNSAFCNALNLGCLFDESFNSEEKARLYPNIKIMLRNAANSYEKAGFNDGANWAIATSTYFDGIWHIIKADVELDLDEKKRLFNLGKQILKSTSELFGKAGYKNKQSEVLNRIELVEKEERILFSALNSIEKPEIASSTAEIIAPACPIEISQSPRLNEVTQITESILKKIIDEKIEKKCYNVNYIDFLGEDTKYLKNQFRVGIAQIGVSTSGNILTEFYEPRSSGLLGIKQEKITEIIENVIKMVQEANKNNIKILIFPEMSIDLNYPEVVEVLNKLARQYEMYLIPGSYHDLITNKNLCRVFSPKKILWTQEKHIPAVIHFGNKIFKEAIEPSSNPREILVCNTEYGRIAIAICRDFLDMDLRVELKNFEPPIDILINPAFTPVTEDFKSAHFDARRSVYAYCFFVNIAEFGESLIYSPEKDRIERVIPKKQEGLIYKDVDLFKLRSERKKWEKAYNKHVKFIQSTKY